MLLNNENFNYFFLIKNTILSYNNSQSTVFTSLLNDLYTIITTFNNNKLNYSKLDLYLLFYIDTVCFTITLNNIAYFMYKIEPTISMNFSFIFLSLFNLFFKLNLILYILLTIFFITNLENYIKQIFSVNMLSKLFILNNNEKEVGPVDDYFFFAILFFLTISIFIFSAIFLIIIKSNIFI